MMFKYDGYTIESSIQLMRFTSAKLDMYGDELRELAYRWERNPDMPVPRYRLRKSIENLERRETALKLMVRKLDSVSRIYERTEERVLDEAESGAEMIRTRHDPGQDGKSEVMRLMPTGLIHFEFRPLNPWRPFRPKYIWPRRKPVFILHMNELRRILKRMLSGKFHCGYLALKIETTSFQPMISDVKWTAKPISENLHVPVCGLYTSQSASGTARSQRVRSLMKRL